MNNYAFFSMMGTSTNDVLQRRQNDNSVDVVVCKTVAIYLSGAFDGRIQADLQENKGEASSYLLISLNKKCVSLITKLTQRVMHLRLIKGDPREITPAANVIDPKLVRCHLNQITSELYVYKYPIKVDSEGDFDVLSQPEVLSPIFDNIIKWEEEQDSIPGEKKYEK